MTKKCFFYLLIVLILHTGCKKQNLSLDSFSFNLLKEPASLNPSLITGSSGNYLLNNLFRGLLFYRSQIENENVQSCRWLSEIHLRCILKKTKLSNGSLVTTKNYIENFKLIADSKSLVLNDLFTIKGMKSYLNKTTSFDSVGIKAPNKNTIDFILDKPDKDFKYILTHPSITPAPLSQDFVTPKNISKLITNGPYKVKEWVKGKYILLEPNPYYDSSFKTRPSVKIYFLENDETAVNLYNDKKMNFLRRLPTSYLRLNKNNKELFYTPIHRFDYIGLTGEMLKHPELRKALALSLNYKELQHIYSSKGLPGCPGLGKEFFKKMHCHSTDIKKAKLIFKQLPESLKNKTWTLYFSRLGGKDIKKGMEWAHNQWKKHLGLKIKLQAVEQGMYLNQLRKKKLNLFRKGVGLDHPTCLSALKTFSTQSGENYINLNDKKYESIIEELSLPKNKHRKKELCSQGISHLLKSYQWIPLGEIHFLMKDDQSYNGWKVNKLNQLDLTYLKKASR